MFIIVSQLLIKCKYLNELYTQCMMLILVHNASGIHIKIQQGIVVVCTIWLLFREMLDSPAVRLLLIPMEDGVHTVVVPFLAKITQKLTGQLPMLPDG